MTTSGLHCEEEEEEEEYEKVIQKPERLNMTQKG